jgi:hypothetical protein
LGRLRNQAHAQRQHAQRPHCRHPALGDDRNFPTPRLERPKELNEMGMNVCAATPRNPLLSTFDRPLGAWNVVASYIEAKGPPEIVDKIC